MLYNIYPNAAAMLQKTQSWVIYCSSPHVAFAIWNLKSSNLAEKYPIFHPLSTFSWLNFHSHRFGLCNNSFTYALQAQSTQSQLRLLDLRNFVNVL
jgi:hypothetical protein